MPPKSKKRRLNNGTAQSTPSPAPIDPDRDTWPGWCEIESEPAFFNTFLREIGVEGLRIHEVFGLDDTSLAILPQPVHAVIFLFRYQEDGAEEQQEKECPPHVWFANQIPENACGTVALLNIVNNVPDLQLGQSLQSFKEHTQSFDPIARGKALDKFDFVRKIHNSFARPVDMLIVDSAMKEKHAKAVKKQKQDAANASRAAKAAEKAAERAAKSGLNPSSLRSNPPRTARTKKPVTEDTSGEESGFHFVAYMPIEDHVWKLDGLDYFPTSIGRIPEGVDWLSLVQTVLSVRMAEYEDGQFQFSLMAVVQDPIVESRQMLAENIRHLQETETRLSQVSQDWRCFVTPESEENVIFGPSEEYGLTANAISKTPISEKLARSLETKCCETLLKTRQELITSQAGRRAAVRDSQQAESMDAEESMHRRHDYGSFVKAWMQALVDNGALSSLLEKG